MKSQEYTSECASKALTAETPGFREADISGRTLLLRHGAATACDMEQQRNRAVA